MWFCVRTADDRFVPCPERGFDRDDELRYHRQHLVRAATLCDHVLGTLDGECAVRFLLKGVCVVWTKCVCWCVVGCGARRDPMEGKETKGKRRGNEEGGDGERW